MQYIEPQEEMATGNGAEEAASAEVPAEVVSEMPAEGMEPQA